MRIRYSFSSRRTGNIEGKNKHRREFETIVKEVISNANILLEILDARFIDDTRNPEMENFIKEKNKRIIYVINKIDIANKEKVKEKLESLRLYPYVMISCKLRQGIKELRDRLKIEAKKFKSMEGKDEESELGRKAQIGVIGYPNTGKSSVINMLIGKASTKTASTAGCTRGIQKIKLTDDLLIIDTPGVLQMHEKKLEKTDMTKQVKIGARDFDRVKNPEAIVADLMLKYPKAIEKFYNINIHGNLDPEEFIEQLGRKKNFLRKGNEVDIDRTARLILKNWQEGKIRV